MTVYWILLLLTAFIAYPLGSVSTVTLASVFFFRRDLRRYGHGNTWLSNFRRIHGLKGLIGIIAVEIVKDALPVIIGGLLLGIKDQAVLGRAFAGFCLVLGRLYPVFNRFRGSWASLCLIVSAFLVRPSIGFITLVLFAIVMWKNRYISVATIAGAAMYIMLSMVLIDNNTVMLLCIFTGLMVILRSAVRLTHINRGGEEKLSFQEDISYKFDEKF